LFDFELIATPTLFSKGVDYVAWDKKNTYNHDGGIKCVNELRKGSLSLITIVLSDERTNRYGQQGGVD
jgi:hypothetical protein